MGCREIPVPAQMNFSRISKPLISIASEIGATETALFAVIRHHRLGQSLKCVMHIRWDDPDAATRQAAIDGFQDLILPCIDQERDGVICVADCGSADDRLWDRPFRLPRRWRLPAFGCQFRSDPIVSVGDETGPVGVIVPTLLARLSLQTRPSRSETRRIHR